MMTSLRTSAKELEETSCVKMTSLRNIAEETEELSCVMMTTLRTSDEEQEEISFVKKKHPMNPKAGPPVKTKVGTAWLS